MDKVYLHVGAGGSRFEGFQNTDKESLDITNPFPFTNQSIDGIASMHVLMEIPWRELVGFFRESYRVLKSDGVFRAGVSYIDSGYELDHILGWGNINLFSYELLEKVLRKVGFLHVADAGYRTTLSKHPIIIEPDNRREETLYIEAFKSEEGFK